MRFFVPLLFIGLVACSEPADRPVFVLTADGTLSWDSQPLTYDEYADRIERMAQNLPGAGGHVIELNIADATPMAEVWRLKRPIREHSEAFAVQAIRSIIEQHKDY